MSTVRKASQEKSKVTPLLSARIATVLIGLGLLMGAFQNCAGYEAVPFGALSSQSFSVPTLYVLRGPAPISNERDVTIDIGVNVDPMVVIQNLKCSFEQGEYENCSETLNFNNLTDGPHLVEVIATDNRNRASGVLTLSWTTDGTAPIAQIISGPAPSTSQTVASFDFTVTDAGSGIQRTDCSLDNGDFLACLSPIDYSGLSVGSHTFRVRTLDVAGNVSAAVSQTWTVTP